jgi:outer membrane receptor protein involved in Fe transport
VRFARALLPVIAALAATSLFAQAVAPAPAPAEKTPAAGEVIKLEAVSVTGSNFKRLDQEKVLPVTVFNREALDLRNALTPVEVLTALPLVTNVPTNEATSGGAGVRGDGATINLRGIGAGSTLVLLNGRRIVPHPITAGDSGQNTFSPNINQLPTQGISHIDVLRDGASSIYGSDAVAGVINYIMREDYRGAEFRLRYAKPEGDGGSSVQGTLTYGQGLNNNKGSFLTTLDYVYRDALYLRDRDFSKSANHTAAAPAPFNVAGSTFDGRSATGYYPSFRVGASTTANYLRPLGNGIGFTTTAPTRAANPEYFLDINDYTMASPRSNRVNWYARATYDLTPTITAFSDLSYYRAKSALVRQPIALNAPGADLLKPLSVDNPYNPYGSRFYSPTGAANADGSARLTGTPQSITWLTGTLKDLDPEHVQVTSNAYRGVAGLKGRLFDTWTWETGVLYTRAISTDLSRDGVRESALAADLLKTDASAYNPFGYTFKVANGAVVPDQVYHNPKSAMDFVQEWRHQGFSSIGSVDARASGELFNLWAGATSFSLGGEFRKEEYIESRPPYAGLNPAGSGLNPDDNDFLTASPKPDAHGDRTVYSAYAETVIPLVAPQNTVPLVQSLEVTGSARFEHYSDFGSTTKPKVGLNWKPYQGAMVRASFNEGFSAPNLPTLYAPTQFTVDSQPGTVDLYRNPYTSEGAYVQRQFNTGNPALQPATSIGKSIGLVLEVPKVKGLTVTADYWQLQQANVINTLSTTQILTNDAALLNAYTAAQLAAGKTIAQIDLGSGTAAYKGSVDVVRAPVTAADQAKFDAYNATHPGAPAAVAGQIVSRSAKFVNLASGYVSGWDMSLNYNLPKMEIGQFNFSTDWTYVIRSYLTKNIPNAAAITTERLNVDGTSRWRGTANLVWRQAAWSAGLSAYYTGSYTDAGASTNAATYASLGAPKYLSKTFTDGAYAYRYIVHDNVTFNAFAAYRFGAGQSKWLDRTSVRVGVINLADREPPLTSGSFGYSASVAGTQATGRTWTLEVNRQF